MVFILIILPIGSDIFMKQNEKLITELPISSQKYYKWFRCKYVSLNFEWNLWKHWLFDWIEMFFFKIFLQESG